MKKIIAFAFVSAAMLSSAFAAEVQGVVKTIDATAGSIELESGEMFTVADGVSLDEVAAGQQVTLMVTDGTTEVTEITAAE